MMITKSSFVCPNCHALYRVVRVEADPEMVEREITCRAVSSGQPVPADDLKTVPKG
jgi:hypothetical protein